MEFVKTEDGTQLEVQDYGQGKAVILIHGWPLSFAMWEHQILALGKADFRVIAYTRRGFGHSGKPWQGYDYDTLADDLAAVIKASGVDAATLVGFSMGGGEVARYMSRHKGKNVARVALVSSVVPYMLSDDSNPGGVEKQVFEGIKKGIQQDRPDFLQNFSKSFYGQDTPGGGVSDAWLSWTLMLAMQASLKATLDCVDAFAMTDFREDLKSFNVPTLIIHGSDDQTVPIDVAGRAAKELLPAAELKEYEGAPHGLFATHAQQLNEDLISFVQG